MAAMVSTIEVKITCNIKSGTRIGIKLIQFIAKVFKVIVVYDIKGETK